jgi:ribosome-associated protein
MQAVEIKIRDQVIRLGQLLKLANIVSSGGEAKILIKEGEVKVNGKVDTRRGAQLHHGDMVEALGNKFVIRSNAPI